MLIHRYSLLILSLFLLLACTEKFNGQNELASSDDKFTDADLFIITEDMAIPFKRSSNSFYWIDFYYHYAELIEEIANIIAMDFKTDEFDRVSVEPDKNNPYFKILRDYQVDGSKVPDKFEGSRYQFRIRDGNIFKGINFNVIKFIDIKKQELTLNNGFTSPVEYFDLTESYENLAKEYIVVSYWKKGKEFGKEFYKVEKTENIAIFNINKDDVLYMCFNPTAFYELVASLNKKMYVDPKVPYLIQLND